jgi:nucleoside-diphosphate-sugar epimerase
VVYIRVRRERLTKSETALVTGANGFLGSHLMELLVAQGHRVKGLVRVTSDLRWVSELPAQLCRGCLEDELSIEQALADVDVVFHCAALTTACSRKEYSCANVEGTRRLVAACRRSSIRRLVFVSSAAAQGPSPDGHPMGEDEAAKPLTPYGRSKLEAELVVRGESGDLEWVTLRPPAIYGPRDTDLLELFRSVGKGVIVRLGFGRRWQNLVHVRDVALAALLAADVPAAAGRVYNVCSSRPESWDRIQEVIAEALGVRARRVWVPSFAVYPVAIWRDLRGRIVGRAPSLTLGKVPEILARYWVLDPSRAEQELGFRAEVSLEDGIRETVEWYRSHGWLS